MYPNLRYRRASGFWRSVRRFVTHERPALYIMLAIPAAAVCLVVAINGNCAALTAGIQSVGALADAVGKTLQQELREAMRFGL